MEYEIILIKSDSAKWKCFSDIVDYIFTIPFFKTQVAGDSLS